MELRSCGSNSLIGSDRIRVAPTAMDGSAPELRSFRLSWQSLLAALQSHDESGGNSFTSCEDENCAESAVASASDLSFGISPLVSGAKAISGNLTPQPVPVFNRLTSSAGFRPQGASPDLPVDVAAIGGRFQPRMIRRTPQIADRRGKGSDTSVSSRRAGDSADASTASSQAASLLKPSPCVSSAVSSAFPIPIDTSHFSPAKSSSQHVGEEPQTYKAQGTSDVSCAGASSARTTAVSDANPQRQPNPASTSSGAQVAVQEANPEALDGNAVKAIAPEFTVPESAAEGKPETRESHSRCTAIPPVAGSASNEEFRQSQYPHLTGKSDLEVSSDDLIRQPISLVDHSAHVPASARLRAGISGEKPMTPLHTGSSYAPVAPLHDEEALHASVAGYALPQNAKSPTAAPSPVHAAASVHEEFASLDSTVPPAPMTWKSAGMNRAEAGFRDPSLGWVTVRAQADAGGVHATLVPATADAGQILGGHLASLNAYMADRLPHLGSVTLSTPDNTTGQSLTHSNTQHNESSEGRQQGDQAGDKSSGLPFVAASNTARSNKRSVATIVTEQHVSVLVE